MSCCRSNPARPLNPLCSTIERAGATLPVYVASTAIGIRFQISHGGVMLDLWDAIKAYGCRGAVARQIESLQREAALYLKLAEPKAGQTLTLGGISRLKG